MKYINIDFFKNTIDIKTTKPVQWFENLFKIGHFITEKLGESYHEEEINTFIKEDKDIICPNGCENRLFYITSKYFTEDKQKRILSAKCCLCNLHFLAYQEISHE